MVTSELLSSECNSFVLNKKGAGPGSVELYMSLVLLVNNDG